jgi:hypothetical protein
MSSVVQALLLTGVLSGIVSLVAAMLLGAILSIVAIWFPWRAS